MAKRKKSTTHSVSRSMERMGLSRRNAERNIRIAMAVGRRATDYCGRARQYLEKAVFGNAYGVVYNRYCYVISIDTGSCITTFELPPWWECEEAKRRRQTRYTRVNSPHYGNASDKKMA